MAQTTLWELANYTIKPRLNRAAANLRHAVQLAVREVAQLGYRRIGLVLTELLARGDAGLRVGRLGHVGWGRR